MQDFEIDHNGTDILSYRYLFAHAVASGDSDTTLRPVLAVAKRGAVNDWAAYIAGVPEHATPDVDMLLDVAHYGAKLSEEQALGFWPYAFAGMSYRP